MRTRAILRLLAALSVFALLATACGDDDTTTAGDDPDGEVSDDTGNDDTAGDDTGTETSTTDDTATDDTATDDMTHDDSHGSTDDMGGDDMGGDDMAHVDHGTVDVAADGAPEVDIEVFADPAGGVNIHVLTENYAITPRAASTDHVEGEGHFHLFVDGEKVLRFYNEWIYYAGVTEGDVDIAVELSANDHRAYAIDGEKIMAQTTFTVPEHTHDAHSHDEAGVEFAGDAPTIEIEVVDDPKSGWNAFITLDGMTLSPEHASTDHVDGEGHLHIYANGQKLGRLYGPATHIAALPEGDVEISVVAYTNDHNPYMIDGQPISAAAAVVVAS